MGNSLIQDLHSQVLSEEQEATFWSRVAFHADQRNRATLETIQFAGSDAANSDCAASFDEASDMKEIHENQGGEDHSNFLKPRESISIAPSWSVSVSVEEMWETPSDNHHEEHRPVRSDSKIWKSTPLGWQKRMSYVRHKQRENEVSSKQNHSRIRLEHELAEMRKEKNGLERVIHRLNRKEKQFNARMRHKEESIAKKYSKLHEKQQTLRQTRAELNKKQYKLRNVFQLAHTDELTGLENVRRFKEVLWQCYESYCTNSRLQFTLVFIDIDFFKEYNDASENGHENGDRVIQLVAQAMRESFKDGFCFRRGGDEFVAILRDTDSDTSIALCRLLQRILHNLCVENELQPATVSVGIASLAPSVKYEDWMKRTEDAMYFVKYGSKNDVCHYNDLSREDLRLLETQRSDWGRSTLIRQDQARMLTSPPARNERTRANLSHFFVQDGGSPIQETSERDVFPTAVTLVLVKDDDEKNEGEEACDPAPCASSEQALPTDFGEVLDLVQHWFAEYDQRDEGRIYIDWVDVPNLELNESQNLHDIGVIHIVDVIKVLFEINRDENAQLKEELALVKRKYRHAKRHLRQFAKRKHTTDGLVKHLKAVCSEFDELQKQFVAGKLRLEAELDRTKQRYHQTMNELQRARNETEGLRERLRKATARKPVENKFRNRLRFGRQVAEPKSVLTEEIEALHAKVAQHEEEIRSLRESNAFLGRENRRLALSCEDLKESKLQSIMRLSDQIEVMREESHFVRRGTQRVPQLRPVSKSSCNVLSPRSRLRPSEDNSGGGIVWVCDMDDSRARVSIKRSKSFTSPKAATSRRWEW